MAEASVEVSEDTVAGLEVSEDLEAVVEDLVEVSVASEDAEVDLEEALVDLDMESDNLCYSLKTYFIKTLIKSRSLILYFIFNE